MNTDKKRILVVDDAAQDSLLVKLSLEQTGDYVVLEHNDPKTAVAAAVEFQPHAILLDVLMPNLSGGEVAACLRAHAQFKDVPIVFLTCIVTKQEIEAGGGLFGGYPFLAKPLVLPELLACLQHQLGIDTAPCPVPTEKHFDLETTG